MRSLDTNRQVIQNTSRSVARPRVMNGFLVDTYIGYAQEVLVQLSDPQRSTRGTVVKARIRPGIVLPTISSGVPVTVQIRHGQAEIVGLGGVTS
jgi:hypothetical protein